MEATHFYVRILSLVFQERAATQIFDQQTKDHATCAGDYGNVCEANRAASDGSSVENETGGKLKGTTAGRLGHWSDRRDDSLKAVATAAPPS